MALRMARTVGVIKHLGSGSLVEFIRLLPKGGRCHSSFFPLEFSLPSVFCLGPAIGSLLKVVPLNNI
jgi:hypothetical protein